MNADAFRHVYAYHFAENRGLWDSCVAYLSDEQFARSLDYSQGSVREQIFHLIGVDDVWFSDLRGVEIVGLDPAGGPDRARIRTYWDKVEADMQAYLALLRDDMLFTQPLEGEDAGLFLWQVLLHVVNHGTDHRAQLLRLLHDLGAETTSQDYVFFAYDNLV